MATRRGISAGHSVSIGAALVWLGLATACGDRGGLGEVNEAAKAAYAEGRLDEAGELFAKAVAIARRRHGDSPQLVESLNNVAKYYHNRGDLAAAVEHYEQAAEVRAGLDAVDPLELAADFDQLSVFNQGLDRFEHALRWSERALLAREETLGPEHLDVAKTLNNLGMLSLLSDAPDEAERSFRRALDIFEERLLAEDPQLALVMTNLARVHEARGEHEAAERLLRDALDYWVRHGTEDSPATARARSNLAESLRQQGRHAEAAELQSTALATLERSLAGVPEVAVALNNLALSQMSLGRWADAESSYRRAAQILQDRPGPDPPELAITLANLGRLYARQDQDAKAEPLLRRALDIYAAAGWGGSPERAIAVEAYAALLRRAGRADEAQALEARPGASGAGG